MLFMVYGNLRTCKEQMHLGTLVCLLIGDRPQTPFYQPDLPGF